MRLLLFSCCLLCAISAAAEETVSAMGMTEPIAQAVVSSSVAGKVQTIEAAEGVFVHKGDVILTLEKDTEAWELQRAKLILDDQADLESVRKKMEIYGKDYRATKALFEQSNSVSEEQLWEKELQFRTAESEYQKLQVLERKEELEYNIALVAYNQRIIRAPFDGVIVKIHKHIAEGVQALEPLVEIVDVRQCRMIAYLVASQTQSLRVGQQVRLELEGAQQLRKRQGRIDYISPVVDQSSMLRTLKIVFKNTDGSIEPGVTGKVLIP